MMPWGYLVPTGLPRPESPDHPIVDEDLVATEPVTPTGGNATDDDESHMRIIGFGLLSWTNDAGHATAAYVFTRHRMAGALAVFRVDGEGRMADVDRVIELVRAAVPDVIWSQLQVKYPADDDGLWFFHLPGQRPGKVQIESSSGMCPFLIEGDTTTERFNGGTPEETARIVLNLLGEAAEGVE
jgi:hypothetical protein